MRALVHGLGLVPVNALRLFAGRATRADGSTLDPRIQLGLRLTALQGGLDFETRGVEAARHGARVQAALFSPARPLSIAAVRDVTVPGAEGPLAARWYRSRARRGPAPALIYFHGGGYVLGDLDTHDDVCRRLALRSGVDVLSVAYRLAPEARFPKPFEDGLAVFRWLRDAASDEGVDPARLAVGGDSAGGNLAAALCVHVARTKEPGPAFQLLFYPSIELFAETPSRARFGAGFGLDTETIAWYRKMHLGDDPDRTDLRISPGLAEDLSGVAPAHIATAGFDPLRDEAMAYAERLARAGVAVSARCHGTLSHAFVNVASIIPAARAAVEEAADALARALDA